MADIVKFAPKPKLEITRHTHNIDGQLMKPGEPEPTERDHHLVGECACGLCDATFKAVVPVGADFPLQCPECKHDYGHFRTGSSPKERWVCQCGNPTFFLGRTGPHCTYCGHVSKDWANA